MGQAGGLPTGQAAADGHRGTDARAQRSLGWWGFFDRGETVWRTWAHANSGPDAENSTVNGYVDNRTGHG